jgi:hypothetical protein
MFGYRRSRSVVGISLLRSGRRSRSFAFRATPCRRWLAGSGGWHRQSPKSCGATLDAVSSAALHPRQLFIGPQPPRRLGRRRRIRRRRERGLGSGASNDLPLRVDSGCLTGESAGTKRKICTTRFLLGGSRRGGSRLVSSRCIAARVVPAWLRSSSARLGSGRGGARRLGAVTASGEAAGVGERFSQLFY